MSTAHTPLPWWVREHPDDHEEFFVAAQTPSDHPYFNRTKSCEVMSDEEYPRKRADAEMIVKSVNAHDDLIKALDAALHVIKSYKYGNSSPELAEEAIPFIEKALKLR